MFQSLHFRKTAKELGMDPATYEKEYNYFLAKLKKFHESKGSPFRRLPWLGGQFLDLYLLYKKVTSYGGWIKVTEDKKWRDIAEGFNLPSTCTNAAFALRQHYSRYLETYERINFFGEDVEDVISSGRPHTPVSVLPGVGPSEYTSPGTVVDITRNFEKLVLSLECGLPNEVDFAINICMLLSNVNNSVFNLTKAPAIIDMLLGHVGVFIEDAHGLKDVYNEWYQKTERDFVKFWRETLEVEEFRDILCGGQEKIEDNEEQLFNPGKKYGVNSVEAQRVAQVCMILYNFSFDETNAEILASHSSCLRFLMLCLCNQMGYLQSLAWNTLCNLAEKMKLEPVVAKNTQILFQILHYFLEDKDRFKVIKAMDVLGKLCIREDNDEVIETALEIQGYESLLRILIIPDVQLVIGSLEALYNISGVGQTTSDQIATVDHGVDILVCMVTLDVEFLGSQALSEVIVIENRLPGSLAMTRPRPTHAVPAVGGPPSPSPVSPHTPSVSSRNEVDAEAFTVKWLQATYEAVPSGTVSRIDLYADYLSSCSRLARIGILNASSFNRIVKFVFPDAQLRRFPTGNQLQYALFGIRRRANPLPVHSTTDQVPPTPPPQVMGSPAAGTPSRGMGTPSGSFHQDVSRTPTPPTPGRNSPNWTPGVPQRPVPQGMNIARQTPPSPSTPFPGNLQNGGFNQGTPIQKVQRRPSLPGQPVISQETGMTNVQQQNLGQTPVTPGQMVRPQGRFPNPQQQPTVNQRPVFNAQNQVPVQQPSLPKTMPSNAVFQQPANINQAGMPQMPAGQWQQNAGVSQGTAFQGTSRQVMQQSPMTMQQQVNNQSHVPAMQGQNNQGQAMQAQVTQNQAMQSHAMPGQAMQNQAVQGQAAQGQSMPGKAMQGQAQAFQRPIQAAASTPTPIQPRPPQIPSQAIAAQNSPMGQQAQQLLQQQQAARLPPNQRASMSNIMQRPGSPGIPQRIAPRGNIFSQNQQGLVPIRPAPPASVQSPSPSSSQPGPGHNERSHNGPTPMGIQRSYQFRPQRPIQGQEMQRFPQGAQLQGFQQVHRAQGQDPRGSSQALMGRPRAPLPQIGTNQGIGSFPVRNSGPIAIAPKPPVDQSVPVVPPASQNQQGSSDGVVLIAREEKAEDILASHILKNAEEQRIIVVENTNNIQKNKMNHQTAIPNENSVPEQQGTNKRDFKSRQPTLNSEGLVTPDQVDHNGHDTCLSEPKRIRLDETNSTPNNIEDSSTLDCTTDEPSGLVNGDIRNDSRNKLMDKLLGKDLHMPLNGVCDINSSELDLMGTEGDRLSGSNSKASSPDFFDSENNSDFGKYLEESDTDTGLFSDVILGDLRLDSVEADPKSKPSEQHKNIPSLPDLGYHAVAQELRNPSSLPSKPPTIDMPVGFSKGAQNSLPDKVPITAVSTTRSQQQRAPGPNEVVLSRYGNQSDSFQGRPQLANHDSKPGTSWNGPVQPPFPPSYQSSVQNNNTPQSIRPTSQQQLNAILEHRTKALVTPRMPVTETQETRQQLTPQQQTAFSKPTETSTNGISSTHPIPGCPGVPVSTPTSSTAAVDGGTQIPRTAMGSPTVETVKPYRCKWANCNSSFDSSKQLFGHVVSTHVPRDSLVMTCMWENCVPVRRSRSSLLFHLQQKHSGPTPVNAPPTPQPQAPPTPTHNPGYFPAYRLLARMMGALQEEEESPLTKTIRLTSALVLRNIAQYSAVARSHLRRHERLLSEVAMSSSEAAHAVAACLSELSPHRKTTEDSNNTFIWAFDR